MKFFFHIGRYFLMIKYTFTKFTKWSVLKKLIFQEIDDLIIGSIGIVAFMSFLIGGVVAIQTALAIENPLLPGNLIGFATRQSVVLEFAPTLISIIMAGKVGSFITSSIGTMRVTEQIDALEVMGINSFNYLIYASFPKSYLKNNKFWPSVRRVDEAFGDRNLICSCPPIDSYE
jgi:phospholipid/cholesterol/gamma-HCH transport system permease protein